MAIDPVERAKATYRLIERKPSSVVFTKPRVVGGDGTVTPETALAAQVVRINSDNRASAVQGIAGLVPKRIVMIYGVVSHPTAPANDIQEGYTFTYEGDRYRVGDPIPGTKGVIQAQAVTV